MKNCLVTKLKSVVDDDNLFYFNKIKFTIDNNEATSVFSVNAPCTVELGTGVTLYKGSTSVGVGPSTVAITSGDYKALGTGQFFLTDYDSVTEFGIDYRNNMQTKGAVLAIADMALTKLTYTAMTAPNELFDFSKKQQDKAVLTRLQIGGTAQPSIGRLKEYAKLFDATYISVTPTGSYYFTTMTDFAYFPSITGISLLNTPGLGGRIEDLVSAFVNDANRNSGSIEFYKDYVAVTFNEEALTGGVTYIVTWNGVNDINVTPKD